MSKQERFTKILQSMRQIKSIKEEGAAAIKAIWNDPDKSSEYKMRAKMEINADTMKKVQDINDMILPEVEALREIMAGESASLDLSNPKLQNALSIINLAQGAELSQRVQENIISQLQDNAPALELLLPMLKKAGMDYAAMSAEELLKTSHLGDRFPETVEDGIYYETLNPEAGEALDRLISSAETFATVNGLEM